MRIQLHQFYISAINKCLKVTTIEKFNPILLPILFQSPSTLYSLSSASIMLCYFSNLLICMRNLAPLSSLYLLLWSIPWYVNNLPPLLPRCPSSWVLSLLGCLVTKTSFSSLPQHPAWCLSPLWGRSPLHASALTRPTGRSPCVNTVLLPELWHPAVATTALPCLVQ